MFAPFAGAEYCRILKPGGVLLHVSPDEEHLWELKQAVYERPYRNDAAVPQQEGLAVLAEEKVAYPLHLDSHGEIVDLFRMTPYAHKTSPADAARLDALEKMCIRDRYSGLPAAPVPERPALYGCWKDWAHI